MKNAKKIQVAAEIKAPVERVWNEWNSPKHMEQWNSASPDWHCPKAENDLRVGGQIRSRMEARDGSQGFDFEGTYTAVEENKRLAYVLGDGRNVEVQFETIDGHTRIIEEFEAESENPEDMQKAGWQSILDNFKAHIENRQQ